MDSLQHIRVDFREARWSSLRLGDADAMLCGIVGAFSGHLRHMRNLIGTREGVRDLSTMIVIGAARSAHVVTQTITVRGIVNMTVLAVSRAESKSVDLSAMHKSANFDIKRS